MSERIPQLEFGVEVEVRFKRKDGKGTKMRHQSAWDIRSVSLAEATGAATAAAIKKVYAECSVEEITGVVATAEPKE